MNRSFIFLKGNLSRRVKIHQDQRLYSRISSFPPPTPAAEQHRRRDWMSLALLGYFRRQSSSTHVHRLEHKCVCAKVSMSLYHVRRRMCARMSMRGLVFSVREKGLMVFLGPCLPIQACVCTCRPPSPGTAPVSTVGCLAASSTAHTFGEDSLSFKCLQRAASHACDPVYAALSRASLWP